MGKQAYIIIHGFEKSYERMAPPLEVIVIMEHSLFWGKFISINLNCQEKMETTIPPIHLSLGANPPSLPVE
jgi:hypothetical protein